MANGHAVFQDSNPSNLLAMFFTGNSSQSSLEQAEQYKTEHHPTAEIVLVEQDSYVRVTKTTTSILP